MQKFFLCLTIFFTLAANTKHSLPDGTSWFTGSVEKAFLEAKKSNKPLFIYWGAVWCPPCNLIKKNIFTQSNFQSAIKNFIAVYLDGDDPQAQVWGAKLQTNGYPTILIMSASGKEVMRIPSGLNAEEFSEMMNSSLKLINSVPELANKDLKTLTTQEWHMLQNYAWNQDENFLEKEQDKAQFFKKLYLGSKNPKFFLLSLEQKLSIEKSDFKDDINPLLELLQKMQKEAKLSDLLAGNLVNISEDIIQKIPDTKIHQSLKKVLQDRADNPKLSNYARLEALTGLLSIDKAKKILNHDTKKQVEKLVKALDEEAKDEQARKASMSLATWVLRLSGEPRLAKDLLTKEIQKSSSAYYYMLSLADIYKEEKDFHQAIEWTRKAYEDAKIHAGPTTSWQWGFGYLLDLLELTPDHYEVIQTTAIEIFSTFVKDNRDEFFLQGRNGKRMGRLSEKLKIWVKINPKNEQILTALKAKFTTICQQKNPHQNCLNWVEK